MYGVRTISYLNLNSLITLHFQFLVAKLHKRSHHTSLDGPSILKHGVDVKVLLLMVIVTTILWLLYKQSQ